MYTKQNDKPGYVVNDHLSWIVVADNLQRPTWEQAGQTYGSLSGLASDGVYTAFCVTVEAVVSYTAIPPLPRFILHTYAMKHKLRRFLFCCTILGVASTGRYPASCPMEPGLSSSVPFRLYSRDHLFYLTKQSNFKTASPYKLSAQGIFRQLFAAHSQKIFQEL